MKPRDLMPRGAWVARSKEIITDRFSIWDLSLISGAAKATTALWGMEEGRLHTLGSGWVLKPQDELFEVREEMLANLLRNVELEGIVRWTGLSSTTSESAYRSGPSVLVMVDSNEKYYWLDARYETLMQNQSLDLTWYLGVHGMGDRLVGVNAEGEHVALLMLTSANSMEVNGGPWLR